MVDLKLQVPVTDEVEVDAETLASIDRAVQAASEGRTYSSDEVRGMVGQWLSEFATQNPR